MLILLILKKKKEEKMCILKMCKLLLMFSYEIVLKVDDKC